MITESAFNLFYPVDAADPSTISGYKTLALPGVIPGAEATLTASVTSAGGAVLLGSFVSQALGLTSLAAGDYSFLIYGKVSAQDSVSTIVAHVYKRTSAGTETEIFNTTTAEIDGLSATLYSITHTEASPTAVDPTDRLVVKFYALTTNASAITVTFYYAGEINQSRMSVPFMVQVAGDMSKATYNPKTDGIISGSGGGGTGDMIAPATGTPGHMLVIGSDLTHPVDGGPPGGGSSVSGGINNYLRDNNI
jgi:hypothetical protein